MATQTSVTQAPEAVRIRFTTREPNLELPENTGPILVSTNTRRPALSSLVNSLLESESPVPFDFLINGSLLRTSLAEFIASEGISAETILPIEFIRSLLPPSHSTTFEHDDWVSSVDVLSNTSPACLQNDASLQSGHERILSGSFDGLLRIWDMSGNVISTSQPPPSDGRVQAISAAKFINPSLIVSGGLDARIRVWNFEDNSGNLSMSSRNTSLSTLTLVYELYGHSAPINSIAVHAPSKHILSGSEDHTVMLWSTESPSTESSLPPAPSKLLPSAFLSSHHLGNKRRKHNANSTPSAGPLLTLHGHSGPVSSVIFSTKDSTVAYTASNDRNLKTYDLTTGAVVTSRIPAAHVALSSLCAIPALGLLATGTVARNILLVDPRVNTTRSSVMNLQGHRGEVSAVAVQSGSSAGASGMGLVSGSFDGTCRIWDLRNANAEVMTNDKSSTGAAETSSNDKRTNTSFRLARKSNQNCDRIAGGEGVKVFDVTWDSDVGIVSGSEDKQVQIDRPGT